MRVGLIGKVTLVTDVVCGIDLSGVNSIGALKGIKYV